MILFIDDDLHNRVWQRALCIDYTKAGGVLIQAQARSRRGRAAGGFTGARNPLTMF